jgi:uncharacterized BrkB/YihY/UPF0761 family membrane protein
MKKVFTVLTSMYFLVIILIIASMTLVPQVKVTMDAFTFIGEHEGTTKFLIEVLKIIIYAVLLCVAASLMFGLIPKKKKTRKVKLQETT